MPVLVRDTEPCPQVTEQSLQADQTLQAGGAGDGDVPQFHAAATLESKWLGASMTMTPSSPARMCRPLPWRTGMALTTPALSDQA